MGLHIMDHFSMIDSRPQMDISEYEGIMIKTRELIKEYKFKMIVNGKPLFDEPKRPFIKKLRK
jgi:hypothetical protein